jgi:hypothetical protein
MSRSQRNQPPIQHPDREARAEAVVLAKITGYRRARAAAHGVPTRTETTPLHPEIDLVVARDPSCHITGGGFISLSLVAARLVEAWVPAEEQAYFRSILAESERVLTEARRFGSELALAATVIRGSGPLSVMRAVARECMFFLHRPRQIGSAAKQAVAQALIAVRAHAGEEGAANAVTQLVAEVRRLDAVAALQRYGIQTSRRVVRLVLRSECDLWLVELEGCTLGLVWRSRTVWCWAQGRREEVLPCVPDSLFEAAFDATASSAGQAPTAPHEGSESHPVIANQPLRRRHARGTSRFGEVPEPGPRMPWR